MNSNLNSISEYKGVLYVVFITAITLLLFISDLGSLFILGMETPVWILFFIGSVMGFLGLEGYLNVRKSKYMGFTFHSLSILMFIIGFIGAITALTIISLIILPILPINGSCI